MSSPRAYFAGFGLHTALGRGVDANLAALRLPVAAPLNATLAFATRSESVPYYLLADDAADDPLARMQRVLSNVIEEAIDAAQLSSKQLETLTLFLGTSSGEIAVHEALFRNALAHSPEAEPLLESRGIGNLALWIMERFGIRGADFTINTACTASANALMQADSMIRSGKIDRALVVGLELCNAVTALGFQGLQLLTNDLMRPFDRRRRGLILGEGCSAVILDREARSAESFFLRGAANLCDTHSISATNVDGSMIGKVMSDALTDARLAPSDIAAVKAHGTASLLNDEAETTGMRLVFEVLPTLCALKPRIGHTLGACGMNELTLLCTAGQQGWLPGTPGICAEASDLRVTLNQAPLAIQPGNFMLNYFGFGGNNTSLIVSNLDE